LIIVVIVVELIVVEWIVAIARIGAKVGVKAAIVIWCSKSDIGSSTVPVRVIPVAARLPVAADPPAAAAYLGNY